MSLVSAFSASILPILLIMGIGYALALTTDVDVEPLNAVALYAFLPALIFHSVATTTLAGPTLLRIFGAVAAFVLVMAVVAEAAARLLDYSEPFLSATVLASAFPNAGFYGIPLAEFTFGSVGRTTAVLYITALSPLMYTAGAYIASRGGGHGGREALAEILRLPLVYAILAAVIARYLGLLPPEGGTVMTTALLVGNASIPLMLVILGIQLARIEPVTPSRIAAPTLLKLGVAPIVATGIALVVAFENVTVARVFVLLCATPVALIPLALTITYGDGVPGAGPSASEYLTSVIFVTTIASVPALTVLIAVLRSGVVV